MKKQAAPEENGCNEPAGLKDLPLWPEPKSGIIK